MVLNGLDELVLLSVQRNGAKASRVIVHAEIERAARSKVAGTTVHQCLRRLEMRGWIASAETIMMPSRKAIGRPIKRYRLTDEGRAALEAATIARQALAQSAA